MTQDPLKDFLIAREQERAQKISQIDERQNKVLPKILNFLAGPSQKTGKTVMDSRRDNAINAIDSETTRQYSNLLHQKQLTDEASAREADRASLSSLQGVAGSVRPELVGKDFSREDLLKAYGLLAGKEKEDELKRRFNIETGMKREQMNKPKELAANMVKTLNEGNAIPTLLGDVAATIQNSPQLFGPVRGTVNSFNSYDTETQTVDSQLRAVSQAFGKYMEGGVLRKEDEAKYRKMFPNLSDTPEVAKAKLATVNNLLRKKQQSDLDAFRAQGFDLTGLDMPEDNLDEAFQGGNSKSSSRPQPGQIINRQGKKYRVAKDGETLEPL